MTMKRTREDVEVEALAMANCLMLLSSVSQTTTRSDRDFVCKTCGRRFPSFQALGGHRASHKKPKLMGVDLVQSPRKPRKHECPICGLEFFTGQALGGHMRRHRWAIGEGLVAKKSVKLVETVPVLKKSGSKRVLCLDLNLTPNENDVTLKLDI